MANQDYTVEDYKAWIELIKEAKNNNVPIDLIKDFLTLHKT